MDIPFMHHGQMGRVSVTLEATHTPPALGAWDGALGLANCQATIEFKGGGYLGNMGWVQLVRSDDNVFHGSQFEIDPFDPFKLYERAPTPYCWYGITPTLFDAPSRDERDDLDWIANTFLAVSPLRGDRRIVMPLLGFSWGFHIFDEKNIMLKPVTPLTSSDWEAHLPYLRDMYKEWQFTEMFSPTN